MKSFKLCPLIFYLFATLSAFSHAFAYYDGEIIDYDCPQYVNKGDIFTVTATVQNAGTSSWFPYFMKLEFELEELTHTESWAVTRTYNEVFESGETKTLAMEFTWYDEWNETFPEEGIFNFYIRVGYVNYIGDYNELDHVFLTVYVGDVTTTTVETTSTSSSISVESTTTTTSINWIIPTTTVNQTITTSVDSETSTTTIDSETTTTTTICPSEQIYGEDSVQTELLRCLRDNVLNQTPTGQEVIRLYYEWSPVIIRVMEEDGEFKQEVKEVVDGVLELIAETE